MAASTTHLGLATIDRSSEARTKLVGEWIDDMNDINGGNMKKIDDAFGKLKTEGTSVKTDIIGDGVKTSFTITHSRNTFSPSVCVFNSTTYKEIYPEIEAVNNNQIKINFLYPIPLGKKYLVTID